MTILQDLVNQYGHLSLLAFQETTLFDTFSSCVDGEICDDEVLHRSVEQFVDGWWANGGNNVANRDSRMTFLRDYDLRVTPSTAELIWTYARTCHASCCDVYQQFVNSDSAPPSRTARPEQPRPRNPITPRPGTRRYPNDPDVVVRTPRAAIMSHINPNEIL